MIDVAKFTAGMFGPFAVVTLIWILLPTICPIILLIGSVVRKGIPAGSGILASLFAVPFALPVQLVPSGWIFFCAMCGLVLLPLSSIYILRMALEPRARK